MAESPAHELTAMNQSVYAVSPGVMLPPSPVMSSAATDLLKQLIELQQEHLNFVKYQQAMHDERLKWANLHGRWAGEFPELPTMCKSVLPKVERAYMGLLQEVTDALTSDENDVFENDYSLAEFLDKYSVRIAQLGNILGPMNNMANVVPPPVETNAE
jgi:hypothetical protein